MPVINARKLADTLAMRIRKLHENTGIARAELDLSGGIDSAVMAGLLHIALGRGKTTFIFLGINSNSDAYARAKGLTDALGEPLINFDGTPLFNDLLAQMKTKLALAGYDINEIEARIVADSTILGSIRSTLRAPWGRAANRLTGGGIRHGTGNECEDRWLRFYQKGGDGEVDTNPISMLSKGEVYQLALYLGKFLGAEAAYQRIIDATPSADLWGCGDLHNDESEIVEYLGVQGYPCYSYINADGSYRTVGLIERVSRFLDSVMTPEYRNNWNRASYGAALFDDDVDLLEIQDLIKAASIAPEFTGVALADVDAVLRSARRIEQSTRHKYNSGCPNLGDRVSLVDAGILTNTLPV